MEDSEADRDILIQRYSADLLADLDRSLGSFLRKPNGHLRKRVRMSETSRLISQVLEPFQELPQLLDPHLAKYLPTLAEAYIERLQERPERSRSLSSRSQLLVPLSNAICRILYTFCKIRGEKVIVHFLGVETRYIELLLGAVEESDRAKSQATEDAEPPPFLAWSWHETYVVLLWLSQLFFAPFDLSTISSDEVDDAARPVIPGLEWPSQVPGIALRVIPLGLRYLASPGKERDGAKALLVRLAMRKDMQEIGITRALIQWALSTLKATQDAPSESPYFYIGSLSLLSGVLGAAAGTSTMDPYLESIYYSTQGASSGDNAVHKVINGSALARKTMIKVIRSIVVLVLRKQRLDMKETEMVENSIGFMLENLADNDTPVRLAASKALSIITLKLQPDLALQVTEAVLESLNRNVLWAVPRGGVGTRMRDLTAVDPLEWHGLMLTLSHLLYRRSPPPEILPDIVGALLLGLAFEKRGVSGASIGTNVRDAACFGVWALARRYTIAELLRVPTKSLVNTGTSDTVSVLQVLATSLIVAASLDSAGNIRRGSSAALQELIGRHPDIVAQGILVVQAVDYHAVALRSRAIQDVALQATKLSDQYGLALRDALLGWRGIGDMDSAARRVAAASFGVLTAQLVRSDPDPCVLFRRAVGILDDKLASLQTRQVEERHGLILSMAAVMDLLPSLAHGKTKDEELDQFRLVTQLKIVRGILEDDASAYRKPELILEAVNKLVVSSWPLFQLAMARETGNVQNIISRLRPGREVVTQDSQGFAQNLKVGFDAFGNVEPSTPIMKDVVVTIKDVVHASLQRDEVEVVEASSRAALISLLLATPGEGHGMIDSWINMVKTPSSSQSRQGNGYLHAAARAYSIALNLNENCPGQLVGAFLSRWSAEARVETRVAILQSLIDRDILRRRKKDFLPIIAQGLDDYHTNARGDVGSHVRLEAIKATKTLWEVYNNQDTVNSADTAPIRALLPRILRLAAEKLDRVRVPAKSTLALLLSKSYAESFDQSSCSTTAYFNQLFELSSGVAWNEPSPGAWAVDQADCLSHLLAGLATSADTGNEDLVISSRAAVDAYSRKSPATLSQTSSALISNLKAHQGQDRVVVPTLELLAHLFHVGILQGCGTLNLRQLCLLTQKACYKTGNIRKLEAAIKIYGGVGSLSEADDVLDQLGAGDRGISSGDGEAVAAERRKRGDGIREGQKRLGALLSHPWPRIRNLVVDEMWGLLQAEKSGRERQQEAADDAGEDGDDGAGRMLLGIDWNKADVVAVKAVVASVVGVK